MCCPGISMSCRSRQDAYEEETMSLNGITKQPGSTSEFSLQVGDPTLLTRYHSCCWRPCL
ncbi:hypothetical protein B711_0352 [Chlamydia psittaci CP3]|nr:hypothetical protein B711_0352 [Chlamydia psittaci CP3]BEU43982.1 hypothetical protein NRM5_002950 [Chlamydia psittaci]